MEEIYWITRLDSLHTLFVVCVVIFSLLSTIAIVFGIAAFVEDASEKDKKLVIKFNKLVLSSLLLSLIGNVFIPTTKEMLLIYGVGGTIDYIKQNETIQQLPDKCVEALDLFIDDYIEGEKDGNKN